MALQHLIVRPRSARPRLHRDPAACHPATPLHLPACAVPTRRLDTRASDRLAPAVQHLGSFGQSTTATSQPRERASARQAEEVSACRRTTAADQRLPMPDRAPRARQDARHEPQASLGARECDHQRRARSAAPAGRVRHELLRRSGRGVPERERRALEPRERRLPEPGRRGLEPRERRALEPRVQRGLEPRERRLPEPGRRGLEPRERRGLEPRERRLPEPGRRGLEPRERRRLPEPVEQAEVLVEQALLELTERVQSRDVDRYPPPQEHSSFSRSLAGNRPLAEEHSPASEGRRASRARSGEAPRGPPCVWRDRPEAPQCSMSGSSLLCQGTRKDPRPPCC